jgi:hypothetical protein
MGSHDVPGANKANVDELNIGCWAEHQDKSLLYVKGIEGDTVVFELYDTMHTPPTVYTHALPTVAFKKQFSYPPTGTSKERWLWHDKTTFPWDRVMATIGKPKPEFATAEQTICAAQRIAESLGARAREVSQEGTAHEQDIATQKGRAILDRIAKAIGEIFSGQHS